MSSNLSKLNQLKSVGAKIQAKAILQIGHSSSLHAFPKDGNKSSSQKAGNWQGFEKHSGLLS